MPVGCCLADQFLKNEVRYMKGAAETSVQNNNNRFCVGMWVLLDSFFIYKSIGQWAEMRRRNDKEEFTYLQIVYSKNVNVSVPGCFCIITTIMGERVV